MMLACTGPAVTPVPGMEIIEQGRNGEFLVATDVDWSKYKKFQLEKATVTFREKWVHDQRTRSGITVREKDEERIKSILADLLDEALKRELSSGAGFVYTDESGADVMRFQPRVVKLDIIAPDRVRDYIGYSLTDSQGNMTLELEIYDSLNGKLLVTARQYQEDTYKGYMEWTTSGTNRTAFRLMLLRWTSWLAEKFEETKTGTPD